MEIYDGGWIDLGKTVAYIGRMKPTCKLTDFEEFVRDTLGNSAPQIYRYIYTDFHGNIRINKNVFKHPDEVIRYLPLILKLDEGTEYGIYFGNTLAETFTFTRSTEPQWGYNITIRPTIEAERINVTFTFKEESGHDEQKPD